MADYQTMLPFRQSYNRYLKKMFHTHNCSYMHTYVRTSELRKYVYFLMCGIHKAQTLFFSTKIFVGFNGKEEIQICNTAENGFALIIRKCISRTILQQQLTNGSPQISVHPGYDIQRAQGFYDVHMCIHIKRLYFHPFCGSAKFFPIKFQIYRIVT